jgi:hypothetical protein
MALSAAIVYWRIPQPTPMPPGPRHDGTAVVRQARLVDRLWWTPRAGGQEIRQPFQMVDLEFTPAGAKEPIHVLDRVDLNSVPGLVQGATVLIDYSAADPTLARMAPGTRTYARQALVYLLGLTYAVGAVLAFVTSAAESVSDGHIRTPTCSRGDSRQN